MTKSELLSYSYRGRNPITMFWSQVEKSTADKCWLFRGCLDVGGYGRITIRNEHWQAHRLSWVIYNTDVPEGLYVLHKCDVRNCVNPRHLWLGTYADNNRDAREKGRWKAMRGEAIGTSKLTADTVKAIRLRYAVGNITQKQLSTEHGVTENCIKHIVDGKSWAHAGGPMGNQKMKERRQLGQKSAYAKLTAKDISVIRATPSTRFSSGKLAAQFGVHFSTIRRIINGVNWKHVK